MLSSQDIGKAESMCTSRSQLQMLQLLCHAAFAFAAQLCHNSREAWSSHVDNNCCCLGAMRNADELLAGVDADVAVCSDLPQLLSRPGLLHGGADPLC